VKDPPIQYSFSNRMIHRFILNDEISQENRDPTVFTKLSTNKQLGSLLEWCLQNYDILMIQIKHLIY
jgi:hypothetical protein